MTDAMTLNVLLGGGKKKTRKVSKKSVRIGSRVKLHGSDEIRTVVSKDTKYRSAWNVSGVEFSVSRDMFEVV